LLIFQAKVLNYGFNQKHKKGYDRSQGELGAKVGGVSKSSG